MASDKKWKDALLSSGLPLESSVTNMLTGRGCVVHGEHEFTVPQPDGSLMHRSVDLSAWWQLPTLNLKLLIECKYRRDGVKWMFLPPRHKAMGNYDWFTNSLVSPFVPPWYCDLKLIIPPVVSFHHQPPVDKHTHRLATKGVQLVPGKAGESDAKGDSISETPVRNALSQVIFGTTSQQFGFTPIPKDHLDIYLHSMHFAFLLPIIVTTAELFILNRDADVQAIRNANQVDDIADQVNTLIIDYPQSAMLRQFVHALLYHDYKRLLESAYTLEDAHAWKSKMFERPAPNQSAFAELQPLAAPHKVLVATLDHLPSLLDEWAAFFSNPDNMALNKFVQETGATGLTFDVQRHFTEFQAAKKKSAQSQETPS